MKNAFSLVELSIVLVILGLLVGGVLTGQNLIRAAELRAMSADVEKYLAATHTFRDKYFALPGDMTNATAFWGAAHTTPATCLTTAGTGTQTCNGDGDGRIEEPAAASQYGEVFTFWQHLASAGLVAGSFSGRAGTGSEWHHTTANAPTGKVSNSLWMAAEAGTASALTDRFDGEYGNVLQPGAATTTGTPFGSLFTPSEVWNIDTKVDDGLPARGCVVVRGAFASCTSAAVSTALDATYLLTSTTKACNFFARNVY